MDEHILQLVGKFAVYLSHFGRDAKPWAWRVAPTLAAAKEICLANREPMHVKRIGSYEDAVKIDHQIERYNDWASDPF